MAVSAFVSLTLTPMMCAKMLRREDEQRENALQRFFERALTGCFAGTTDRLVWVLRHQTRHPARRRGHPRGDGRPLRARAKGPAASAGHRLAHWRHGRCAGYFLSGHAYAAAGGYGCRAQDPDVERVAAFVGAGTVNSTPNTGRLYIVLKPRESRDVERRSNHSPPARRVRGIEGVEVFFQAAQDLQIDTRTSRTQYQYILEDSDAAELGEWGPKLVEKLRTLPELADVASDQQMSGLQLHVRD